MKEEQMPDFPIIDAHLHVWDPARIPMGWMTPGAALNRAFSVEDYAAATQGIAIEAMVFVECFVDAGAFLCEVDYVAENAARDPRIMAIVANAPLELGDDARPFLEALVTRHGTVRGIRRMIEFQADTAIATRPGFRAGVQALRDYDLSFDVNVHHSQMDQAVDLSRHVEGVRLILDHCGKPPVKGGIRDRRFAVWRDGIRAFAQNPDAYCKLSDLPVEADHAAWTAADLQPYIDAVVETFGFDRLIFAFDWPVCTQATTPHRWLEVLDTAFAGVGQADLRAFYAGNARRVYRMGA
jgi:L-fuconolactonase